METSKEALLHTLTKQRDHIIGILDGLDHGQLTRPVLPSGWTALGLVNHLALDVEHFWFQAVVAGEEGDPTEEEADAWQVAPEASGESILGRYRAEIARADEIVKATPLDEPPKWWPDFFGSFRLPDLQAILLHVIAETACHAGHLDALRELIDARQWVVL